MSNWFYDLMTAKIYCLRLNIFFSCCKNYTKLRPKQNKNTETQKYQTTKPNGNFNEKINCSERTEMRFSWNFIWSPSSFVFGIFTLWTKKPKDQWEFGVSSPMWREQMMTQNKTGKEWTVMCDQFPFNDRLFRICKNTTDIHNKLRNPTSFAEYFTWLWFFVTWMFWMNVNKWLKLYWVRN